MIKCYVVDQFQVYKITSIILYIKEAVRFDSPSSDPFGEPFYAIHTSPLYSLSLFLITEQPKILSLSPLHILGFIDLSMHTMHVAFSLSASFVLL